MLKFGKKRAKLLYITSAGHSGSTLLDLLCGTISGVFSMGEVQFLSWQLIQGEVPSNSQTYCSCGKNFKKCTFWGRILNEISNECNLNVYSHPKKYNFSLNRNMVRNKKNFFIKMLNKILTISTKNSITKFLSYPIYWYCLPSIKRNWDLFDRAAYSSDSKYVVDSSKDFLRFWLLKMHRPDDVKLIILIRDVKGVASSSHHGLNQEIIDRRSKDWLYFYNKRVEPAFKYLSINEYKIIKYEQLCEESTEVRNEICEFLNIENNLGQVEFIEPYSYHTIQGNPMRLIKKNIKIKYDERWRKRLSDAQIKALNNLSNKLKYDY